MLYPLSYGRCDGLGGLVGGHDILPVGGGQWSACAAVGGGGFYGISDGVRGVHRRGLAGRSMADGSKDG